MLPQRSVLIVDDEQILRTVLSGELSSYGYLVDTAADGDEAITVLQARKFDIVILDINMPKVDGFEVLNFIKKYFPETRVIMLTSFSDLKNAIESTNGGADDFISKPYDFVDLVTTIERVLQSPPRMPKH